MLRRQSRKKNTSKNEAKQNWHAALIQTKSQTNLTKLDLRSVFDQSFTRN